MNVRLEAASPWRIQEVGGCAEAASGGLLQRQGSWALPFGKAEVCQFLAAKGAEEGKQA